MGKYGVEEMKIPYPDFGGALNDAQVTGHQWSYLSVAGQVAAKNATRSQATSIWDAPQSGGVTMPRDRWGDYAAGYAVPDAGPTVAECTPTVLLNFLIQLPRSPAANTAIHTIYAG